MTIYCRGKTKICRAFLTCPWLPGTKITNNYKVLSSSESGQMGQISTPMKWRIQAISHGNPDGRYIYIYRKWAPMSLSVKKYKFCRFIVFIVEISVTCLFLHKILLEHNSCWWRLHISVYELWLHVSYIIHWEVFPSSFTHFFWPISAGQSSDSLFLNNLRFIM